MLPLMPGGRSCRWGRWQGPEVYFAGRAWPWATTRGDVAQLGERCVRIAEARGSSPLISTIRPSPLTGGLDTDRMPDAAIPTHRHRLALRLAAPLVILAVAVACAGDSAGTPGPSALGTSDPAPSQAALAPGAASPSSAVDSGSMLCTQIGAVQSRTAALRAVELRLPNRVALDIELGKLQAAFVELAQADLGPFAEQLEGPLTRLGYRLAEVELAVEDFRTNSRPQRAVTHVETDARTFADELASFAILARC